MTRPHPFSPIVAAAAAALVAPGGAEAWSDDQAGDLVLIRDDLGSQSIRLVQLDDETLVHMVQPEGWNTIDLDRCIALFDPTARRRSFSGGVLLLTNGERLPGQAISNPRPDEEVVAWNHSWLGRVSVPLDQVRSLQFGPDAPTIEPGDADVVALANGDRLEGFILAFGNPISLEVTGPDGPEVVDVPLERVTAVSMVTPEVAPANRRVWLRDGTIIEVSSLRVGDDGFVRLRTPRSEGEQQEQRLRLEEIAAVLFAPGAMMPLAALAPSRVTGPGERYVIPAPASLDPEAALELSRLEYRGPLVVHYALPTGARRFAAEARLPVESRDWGDFELIVRDDDREVFRTSLNSATPTARIEVDLRGAELTIELTEGRHGPIQDRLILERPMLLR